MDWTDGKAILAALSSGSESVERWAGSVKDKPFESALAVVGVSSVLFYQAEKGHNPKVNDFWDALVYCTTCMSVGYSDVFARTSAGKMIGSFLMTVGPALAAKILDGSSNDRDNPESVQREILATLKELLMEVRARQPLAN